MKDSIAIVGYDDVDFAAAAAVPLSSVRQPRHQLGRAAAQLLIGEAPAAGPASQPATAGVGSGAAPADTAG